MRYIETMKTEFFEYKAQVEETINDLNEKLSFLQKTGSTSPDACSGEAGNDLSISEATDQLRQVADDLICNLNLLLDRLHLQKSEEPSDEETPVVTLDEEKEETAQDKVDSLLSSLFSSADNASGLPATEEKPAAKQDVLSVLPHYLNN